MKNKESLKRAAMERQGGFCAECGEPLGDDLSLIHTHRFLQRKDGGGYTEGNYCVLCPKCHFKRHGILKVRPEDLAELKTAVDSYRQTVKLRCKIENQERAAEADIDILDEQENELFDAVGAVVHPIEKLRRKAIEKWFRKPEDGFITAILSVRGVGPISAAECLIDIDLTEARHASSLWMYVGYDRASIDRYKKGEAGGGNKGLRTALYNLGRSFLKANGTGPSAYAALYYSYKGRLEVSEKLTRERRRGDGKIVEVAWKDAMPIHRDLAALRYMMKAYLADYWFVGRTILGLPTDALYVNEKLGHDGATIDPKARGWVW